jgi:hypothetical protein
MWFGLVFLYPNQIILRSLGGKQVPPLQPVESPLVGKCKQNLAKKVGAEIREPRVPRVRILPLLSKFDH